MMSLAADADEEEEEEEGDDDEDSDDDFGRRNGLAMSPDFPV